MKEYLYDVFLSFTGMDRDLKTRIREYLESEPYNLKCYDSDKINTGDFRNHYCEGIDQSRVYLLILTDSLYNDPSKSGKGFISEVRKEVNLALECEAANELNIVILCLSEFFSFGSTFHDYNDSIGWFFYTHTRSYSQVRGIVDGDGAISEQTLSEIKSRCKQFVDKRNEGKPAPSVAPKLEIAESKLPECKLFIGRDAEIDVAVSAFESGKQAVVLRGSGGMGKTHLATEIARRCNESGNLNCPQIVYIGECSERDGLHTLTSSVSYTKQVYESLSFLSERDRFERKLNALAALPEYILLVIDNYNAIKQRDLTDLLEKLKCRLLITTRARLEEDTAISVIGVERLDPDNAYDMFCRTLGAEPVSRTEFDELYKFVGGHTMTLCIIGKMMALHKSSITEMIKGMSDLGAMEERIDFVHNDHRGSDTIMGHLTYLFGMSSFSDGSRRILRSMSILETGMIETSVLMHVLKLRNRNEISELVESGWLDVITQTVRGKDVEFLRIHPIISLLMVDLLVPTEENVPEMANHISESANRMRDNMTYADAAVLDEGLYYACRILTRTSNKLPQKLWDSLVDVNHLLGDEHNTARKVSELSAIVSDPSDSVKITMYSDMVILEQHPTRTDVIEKYLGALDKNANDYKWVLRCLSVTLPHIIGASKHHPFLRRALEKAVDAAIVFNDDFALFDLMIYTCFLEKEHRGRIVGKIKQYVKKRKKEGAQNVSLLLIEMQLFTYANKGFESFTNTTIQMTNDMLLDNNGSLLGTIIKHPLISAKMTYLSYKFEKLDDDFDDPMAYPFKMLYSHLETALDSGMLNAQKIIEALVQLQINRYEHQISLAPMENAVEGLLSMLKKLPDHAVSYEVRRLSQTINTENLSVRELSNLRVAAKINLAYNNPAAIQQSRQLISVLRTQRPEGHPDIIAAVIAHADVCYQFGMPEHAISSYINAFNTIQKNSPDSSQFGDVAQKILRTQYAKNIPISSLKHVLKIATQNEKITDWKYSYALYNYGYMLIGKARENEITTADPAFGELLDDIIRVFNKIKDLDTQTKKNYIYLLYSIADRACYEKNGSIAEECEHLLAVIHKRCTKTVSHLAYAILLSVRAIGKYYRNEDDFVKLYNQAASYCIKKKSIYNQAASSAHNIIELARVSTPEELISLMIKKSNNLQELDALIKEMTDEKGNHFITIYAIRKANRKLIKTNYSLDKKLYRKLKTAEDLYMYIIKEILYAVSSSEVEGYLY